MLILLLRHRIWTLSAFPLQCCSSPIGIDLRTAKLSATGILPRQVHDRATRNTLHDLNICLLRTWLASQCSFIFCACLPANRMLRFVVDGYPSCPVRAPSLNHRLRHFTTQRSRTSHLPQRQTVLSRHSLGSGYVAIGSTYHREL